MIVKPRPAVGRSPLRKRNLFLLRELVVRDLKSRFAGSVFGPLWIVATPLLWLILYSFVFSVVLRIPLTGEPPGVNFPEFLLAAFLPWLAVQEGISRATTCLTDNAAMVKKAVFPIQSLVETVVVSALVSEVAGLILFAAYLGWRGDLSAPWLLLLVPALLLQILITFGLGCLLAGLNVFFRDTAQAVVLVLAMLSFATPIFYPAAAVPRRFQWVMEVNPFTHLVEFFRDLLLRHRLPAASSLLFLSLFALVSAAAGALLFSRGEPHFADLL